MKGKKLHKKQVYWGVSAIAREAGIDGSTLKYWFNTGRIIAPKHLIGKRRYYSSEEASLVLEQLFQRITERKTLNKRYNLTDVCTLLGFSRPTLEWHLKHDCFPQPDENNTFSADGLVRIKHYFDSRIKAKKSLTLFENGMKNLGATTNEIQYAKRYHLPAPKLVTGGNSLRVNWYTKEQVKRVLQKTRMLRKERGLK